MSGAATMPPLKRCTRCGEEKPLTSFYRKSDMKDGRSSWCKNCTVENMKAWVSQNRTKERATRRKRYRNSDEQRKHKQDYQKRNRETIRARMVAYRKANRERLRHIQNRWVENNREYINAYFRNRYALKQNAEGEHSAEDIAAKLKLQGGLCYYCKADLKETGYHVDHKIPLSRGGSNWPANLCCACPTCNLSKRAKTPQEFLAT